MASITTEKLKYAKLLLEYCEVRYIALDYYLETTVIDGNNLFRFKGTSLDQEVSGNVFSFKNSFNTTDLTYVEKTKNMLEDVWSTSMRAHRVIEYYWDVDVVIDQFKLGSLVMV